MNPTFCISTVLLVLAAAGCVREGAPGGARAGLPGSLAGCWAVFDRHGRPASDSLYFAPPRMRLDTTFHPLPRYVSGLERAWPLLKLDSSGLPMSNQGGRSAMLFWALDSASDTVRVWFHTGFSGTELRLGIPPSRADTLRGRAEEHSDVGPPFESDRGRATAIRIPCSPAAAATG